MAKRLVITWDHIESASRALEAVPDTLRGHLAWEIELQRKHLSYWGCLERLFIGAGELSDETRKLTTFAYDAVLAASKSFPHLDESHWKEAHSLFSSERDARGALQAWERGSGLMHACNPVWAESFDGMMRTSLAKIDGRLARSVWCAVIVLLAKVLDEPFRPVIPEGTARDDEASLKGAVDEASKPAKDVSRARSQILMPVTSTVSFADIGGLHYAKNELIRLAARINQPSVGKRWGSRPIRAVLLKGPKGTGKTTLANALASATHLPFFRCKISDVLSIWVNHSHMLLSDLFTQVTKGDGGLILLDEADAILVKRGTSHGHSEDDKVVNQWNQCMDELNEDDRIYFVLATNFEGKLDDAAIRDGRVDLVLDVPPPKNDQERREIIRAHTNIVERRAGQSVFKENINLFQIAREMDGMTGAMIEGVINIALRRKEDDDLAGKTPGLVTTDDLLSAIAKRLSDRPLKDARAIGFRNGPPPLPEAIGVFEPMKPRS